MKRETLAALSLATLTALSSAAPASAQQNPQYPPPGYPPQPAYPPGYPPPPPQQPQRPPQQPAPQYPPQAPQQPGYPPQPAYPPGYPPPRPQQPAPQQPAPQYPPAPQQPPPGYPPPGYPPPQQPAPGYPPGYPPPQQPAPGYPPGYPQQPGYPPQAAYPGYDPYAALPAPNQHLGFMIRLQAGPNYTTTGFTESPSKYGVTGFGIFGDLAVGFAPIENFCIYGEASLYTMLSGSWKASSILINGVPMSGDGDEENSYYLLGFGPGASYYIMPINIYVGGSLQLVFQRGDAIKYGTIKPDVGIGLNFDAGKEFFVTPDWGVGVNLRVAYARNGTKFGGTAVSHNSWTSALALTATFN